MLDVFNITFALCSFVALCGMRSMYIEREKARRFQRLSQRAQRRKGTIWE